MQDLKLGPRPLRPGPSKNKIWPTVDIFVRYVAKVELDSTCVRLGTSATLIEWVKTDMVQFGQNACNVESSEYPWI